MVQQAVMKARGVGEDATALDQKGSLGEEKPSSVQPPSCKVGAPHGRYRTLGSDDNIAHLYSTSDGHNLRENFTSLKAALRATRRNGLHFAFVKLIVAQNRFILSSFVCRS